jgi:MerR family transcriptional regulator, copper efflux regulator
MTESLLKIGEIHSHSQIPIKTIRYYEDIGLIRSEKRSPGGFRLFSPAVLVRLGFIKRSQALGFSLQEIRYILDIHDQGELPCTEVRHNIERKIQDIDDRIQQLQQLKQELSNLMTRPSGDPSQRGRPDVICPILQSPDHPAPERHHQLTHLPD